MRREVLEAMFPYFQQVFGNPSSVHALGAEAAVALTEARTEVAEVLGCLPDEVVFTSGGTESDNLAVLGAAEAGRSRGNHVLLSAIEHEAVLEAGRELRRRGFDVEEAPVDAYGRVHPTTLAQMVRKETILVSVMYVNNEIGTIQPIADLRAAVRERNPASPFHTDAVQAAGTLPLDVDHLGVDLLSLSAHKLYGPRGVGALYVRRGTELWPTLHGGGQERGLRSGTENVAGAVGLSRALSLAAAERSDEAPRLRRLSGELIERVTAGYSRIHLTGHPTERLPGHASFYLEDRSGESVLVELDRQGISCSSGSACHAGQTDPSHVLLAIGLSPELARNGLRLTLGRQTSAENVAEATERLLAILTEQPLTV